MNALITGATGLVGTQLFAKLNEAKILTRSRTRATSILGPVRAIGWDPLSGPPALNGIGDIDAVFNLAGEPVSGGRWSKDTMRSIYDSRVIGTHNLVAGLAQLQRKPKVLVSASAIGIYGDRGEEKLDEASGTGTGFLADVCEAWEHEAMAATQLGIRVVCVRVGIVLSAKGGALPRMLTPFNLGVGGRLGTGKQWMSWIHIDDLVGLLLHASHSDDISGCINAVSPNPVRNSEFTRQLGESLHRPTLLPVPKTALRLAFGKMSEIMLASQRVYPAAAVAAGYQFEYSTLSQALTATLAKAAS